jgi:hypothetical protein
MKKKLYDYEMHFVLGLPVGTDMDAVTDALVKMADDRHGYTGGLIEFEPLGKNRVLKGFKFYSLGGIELPKKNLIQGLYRDLIGLASKYGGFIAGQFFRLDKKGFAVEVIRVKK